AVAGVVADHGEVLGALADQRVDERDRHAGHAEAADQDGRAVLDARQRLVRVGEDLGHAVPTFSALTFSVLTFSVLTFSVLTFSRTTASPCPTPMQMAATPHRARRSRSTWARVPRTRPPEAPSGWPMAIAPPLTLTIPGSTSQASTQASDCTAKASFSSTAPTSDQPMPAR